jgi:hypothetical protein
MQWLVGVIFVIAAGEAVFGHPATPPAAAASAPVSIEAPAGSVTPASWAQTLLAALGDGITPENLRAITSWERAEGGHWANAARFNPLNTTQTMPGSRAMNSVGVQAYTSWGQGLTATVTTLRNGRYGSILGALRAGDCAACVAAAVGASPWGTGRFAV